MTPVDYADWSKEDLVAEIKKLARRKKYGLVWEEKDEEVAITLNENLPIFEQVKSRAIVSDKSLDSNILIEGDNLHALTSLAFTHQGEIDLIYIDPHTTLGKMTSNTMMITSIPKTVSATASGSHSCING